MDWVTPLGLPVTQPYHRETTEEIPTPVQNVALTTMFDSTKQPHLTKQKGGFAPNFVHSLDSCHMMLTSLYSQREGITFASVHDSFWTHASTVPIMSKVILLLVGLFRSFSRVGVLSRIQVDRAGCTLHCLNYRSCINFGWDN